jgi:hypothetical protein
VYIALALAFVIFVVILSAALVIAVVLVFTIYAMVKMVRLIDSGHASPMAVGFVATDAVHRLVILVAASAVVPSHARNPLNRSARCGRRLS